MTRPTCATCCHYDPAPEQDDGVGYCRVGRPEMGAFGRGVWPLVDAGERCAEHFEAMEEGE